MRDHTKQPRVASISEEWSLLQPGFLYGEHSSIPSSALGTFFWIEHWDDRLNFARGTTEEDSAAIVKLGEFESRAAPRRVFSEFHRIVDSVDFTMVMMPRNGRLFLVFIGLGWRAEVCMGQIVSSRWKWREWTDKQSNFSFIDFKCHLHDGSMGMVTSLFCVISHQNVLQTVNNQGQSPCLCMSSLFGHNFEFRVWQNTSSGVCLGICLL